MLSFFHQSEDAKFLNRKEILIRPFTHTRLSATYRTSLLPSDDGGCGGGSGGRGLVKRRGLGRKNGVGEEAVGVVELEEGEEEVYAGEAVGGGWGVGAVGEV